LHGHTAPRPPAGPRGLLPAQDAPAALGQQPTPLASRIDSVVLHSGLGRVSRVAELPGSGVLSLSGLPGGLDPDNVRVRVGGESHAPSRDARWLADLEERGLRSGIVSVPRGGASDPSWQVRTSWPAHMRLTRR
jgi:hypothetical protein